jgi:nitroreductase
MTDFLNWLSSHTVAALILIAAATVCLVLLIAFLQGRALSLWPPRIEGKPLRLQPGGAASTGVAAAIRARKSVRTYLDQPVEETKLTGILEAGRLAPSASNRQEWRFVVVREPQTRRGLAEAATAAGFVGTAPVVLAACAETDDHVMQCGQLSYPIDVAIALDHLTLAAAEAGLGTCWVAMFDEKKVKELLGIPDKIRVVALMPVGYPADPSPVEKRRLPLDRIVKYEHW